MEKTVTIDGRPVRFKASGGCMYRYKAQFGREMLADAVMLDEFLQTAVKKQRKTKQADGKVVMQPFTEYDYTKLSLEAVYNILWTYAKTADESIPEPQEWLDSFTTFPVMDIYEQIKEITDVNFKVDRKNG